MEIGSQPGNLDRIARGEADATAVDCVTYAFWRRYRPAAAERVRVVAQTPPSPAIPFVTSADTPAATVELLRAALHELALSPRYAGEYAPACGLPTLSTYRLPLIAVFSTMSGKHQLSIIQSWLERRPLLEHHGGANYLPVEKPIS